MPLTVLTCGQRYAPDAARNLSPASGSPRAVRPQQGGKLTQMALAPGFFSLLESRP